MKKLFSAFASFAPIAALRSSLSLGERAGVRAVRKLLVAVLFLFTITAHAADFQVVGYVTVTNIPAGPATNIVINIGTADTRYYTNGVVTPSTSIQLTNTTAATVTNTIAHFSTYPVYSLGSGTPQAIITFSTTNTSAFEVAAPVNTNLSISFGGNWARVYYVTSTFNLSNPILVDTNRMSAVPRTNALNAVVNLLSSAVVASNTIAPGKAFMAHYTDNTSSQNLSNKTLTAPIVQGGRIVNATNLTGTNVAFTNVTLYLVAVTGVSDVSGYIGSLTNGALWSNILHRANISNAVAIGGIVHRLTNGYWTNGVLSGPKTTNLINYGNAISSPNTNGMGGENFGKESVASGLNSFAAGYGATATASATAALGFGAQATNTGASATGTGAIAGGSQSSSYGSSAEALGTASGAWGALARSDYDYSDAVGGKDYTGTAVTATSSNQVRIGTAVKTVSIAGRLEVEGSITNSTLTGTNVLNARLDLTARANTTLANGYNSGVVFGTNTYIRFSGPTAAYTNAGFAAPGGPQFVIAQFDNPGLSFTLLPESGLEATTANRILTGTGALMNSTNNPVMAQFLYDTSVSRWRVISFR